MRVNVSEFVQSTNKQIDISSVSKDKVFNYQIPKMRLETNEYDIDFVEHMDKTSECE